MHKDINSGTLNTGFVLRRCVFTLLCVHTLILDLLIFEWMRLRRWRAVKKLQFIYSERKMRLCIVPPHVPGVFPRRATSHAQSPASPAAGRAMAERLKVTESNFHPDNNWFSLSTKGIWANLWSTQAVSRWALIEDISSSYTRQQEYFSSVVQFKVERKKTNSSRIKQQCFLPKVIVTQLFWKSELAPSCFLSVSLHRNRPPSTHQQAAR